MAPLKKLMLSLVILALSSSLSAPNIFAEEASTKYQSLFFPKSMPLIKGVDGKNRPMGYEFYYEGPLPNSNINIILFSEIVRMGEADEDIYIPRNVYVAVVQDNKRVLSKIKASIDAGEPDYYYEMGGTLTHFNLSPTIQAEHLYLWGVIAGSGGQEFGTDCFYIVDKTAGVITQVLELDNSFSSSQAGVSNITSWETDLYIADIDNDGKMEFLTRKHNFRVINDVSTDSWSDTIDVYHYNDATGKYEPAGKLNALPANAVELEYKS